ncbi:ring zinc finger and vwf domain family protein [Pelomyxa schiedti]|nr:ring zinc finger and vwf domain family protein [Pelomyxa schiedti]
MAGTTQPISPEVAAATSALADLQLQTSASTSPQNASASASATTGSEPGTTAPTSNIGTCCISSTTTATTSTTASGGGSDIGGAQRVTSDSGFSLCVTAERGSVAYNSQDDVIVMASVTAPSVIASAENRPSRPPVDVVAVVDKSGSMRGDKLQLVGESLKFMIQQLKSEDQFCIVTYDTAVSVALSLRHMDASGKRVATDIIGKIKAGSCTNLSGGLFQGLTQLQGRTGGAEVASVLLFTDGLANSGLTKSAEIIPALATPLSLIKGQTTIFTFGFGADHDPVLLRDIANAGHGMYYYIENTEKIPGSFADCIGGLLSVCAQNISLVFEAVNGTVISQLMTNYTSDFKPTVSSVSLGDIYIEESRDILAMVHLPQVDTVQERMEIVNIQLTLYNIAAGRNETLSTPLCVSRTESTPTGQPINAAIDLQRNRILTTDALRRANETAKGGDLASAKNILQAAITQVTSSITHTDPLSILLLEDLRECMSELDSREDYNSKGSKKMVWMSDCHSKQRCCGKSAYVTSSKADMIRRSSQPSSAPTCEKVPSREPPPSTTASTVASTSNSASPPVLGRMLVIGNEHTDVPASEATLSVAFPDKRLTHKWKLYVRGDQVEDIVEKVEVELHPSFQPSHIIVSTAPFEVERCGWGFFAIPMVIHFKPAFSRPPLHYDHQLDFGAPDTHQEVRI